MDAAPPLASGRTADVFAVDEGRVLRRYRDGRDATAEAQVMAYLDDSGFPVPKVYAINGGDLVLERLAGPTMLQALAAGHIDPQSGARLLADLHRRLHELPARTGAQPGDRILHLDLHPDNVMLSSRGPVVIDWRNVAEGPADLDLAMSGLIMAQVAVDEAHQLRGTARQMLVEFLASAGGDPRSQMDAAVAVRRADQALTATEIDRLEVAALLVHHSAPTGRQACDRQGRMSKSAT